MSDTGLRATHGNGHADRGLQQFRHPGAGRGQARPTPKGRVVDPRARQEVQALLGDRPLRRDLLIEHLHVIQDAKGQLSAAHLAALADLMGLAMTEVYEVATFYAHFDVVKEGETPPPPLTVRVCDSVTCALYGSEQLIQDLKGRLGPAVRVVRAPCVGLCDVAPAVEVGHHFVHRADAAEVELAVKAHHTEPQVSSYIDHAAYVAGGGYALLGKLRSGALSSEAVLKVLDDGMLRGLGGGGFPAGRKWRAVKGQPGPRLMAVNADEGEPGTFKDRHFLYNDPHRVLEGMLIGAHIVQASDIYFYLRDEYPIGYRILERELAKLPPGGPNIHLRRGAGAYIVGEETSMLESIEGKRGLPRQRPPYPFQAGLFGKPTLINNVETLYWVREILEKGAAWWASQGRNGGRGLRAYSVSGRVRDPGVKIAPAGVTARQLIDEYSGGMAAGHRFAAYLPGGASGGILPAAMADIPLDFGTLEKYGCLIGSAGLIVLSDQDDVKEVALNLMRFFEDESCGQCTPCRSGTQKARILMEHGAWDRPLLTELGQAMHDASICGLGWAAPNPMECVIRHFPELFANGGAAP